MSSVICDWRANETGRQASVYPYRVFLPKDPAGSQGQTGNNGLYGVDFGKRGG